MTKEELTLEVIDRLRDEYPDARTVRIRVLIP